MTSYCFAARLLCCFLPLYVLILFYFLFFLLLFHSLLIPFLIYFFLCLSYFCTFPSFFLCSILFSFLSLYIFSVSLTSLFLSLVPPFFVSPVLSHVLHTHLTVIDVCDRPDQPARCHSCDFTFDPVLGHTQYSNRAS
jgi:hypothetical protein